ncbi:MAG: DUF5674 family protein [bacterium]
MKIIESPITLAELDVLAKNEFDNFIKAVVDIEKEIMVVDASLHADEEALLLEHGSSNKDLWGINLYPALDQANWIEFDSMINLRPSQNNNTRSVDDPLIQAKIIAVVEKLIKR